MIKILLVNKNALHRTDLSQNYSDIAILSSAGYDMKIAAKKIRAQVAADYLRRYLGRSQTTREFSASFTLRSIGVGCPEPIARGVNLSPFGPYESLYISEYIRDAVTGKEYLLHHRDKQSRKLLLKTAAHDLATIHGKGLFHRDSHLGNILCLWNSPSQILWIDNDLERIKGPPSKYETIALERFQKILRKGIVSAEEWDYFLESYGACLRSKRGAPTKKGEIE
ncbi:MAG: hypothetical protein JW743_09175 [Deltaproteobacteria bacterium]|nr:hypothetical protein [Deltaproteobacteria bacterium]